MNQMVAPDVLEEALFLTMLQLGREGAGPDFELSMVADVANLKPTVSQLIAFARDHDEVNGKANLTTSSMRFALNPAGRRHAIALEKQQSVRKPVRLLTSETSQKLIAFGNFIVAAVALGVAIAAYLKASS